MPDWVKYALGVVAVVGGIALVLFVQAPVLACDRGEAGEGRCTMVSALFFFAPQERTFLAANLRAVRLEQVKRSRQRDGYRLYIRLAYTEYELATASRDPVTQQAIADQITAYIADPTERGLRLGTRFNPWILGIMGIGVFGGLRLIARTWATRSGRSARALAPATPTLPPSPRELPEVADSRPRRSRTQAHRERGKAPRR